ncbi:hypothetical protein F9802_10150 [Bacillus aerolatus]|uniref:DUF4046 domain-containing protein n=1 Tax=Bacillus aerolatus TaxID=2653354 RepID=A0A6I1FF42_9BACI|nr:hypothetical protein [Bacillus aerolatus]KAB7706552.1 hypothetical protein F9802_10150 [Bacillus aerolatus]
MKETCIYNFSNDELIEHSVVKSYHNLLAGQIHALPPGTWQNDENVIVLIRYVLEVKLGLSRAEIPRITRTHIKENKLWGALNRFKSIRKLIHFVYLGEYQEFDFHRVPVNYWADIERIKERFEWWLQQEGLTFADIPSVVNCELLLKWGVSNPLKRHGDSPFRLLHAIYPNHFKATDFKKTPQRYRKDNATLKKQIIEILQKENIFLEDVPKKVNRDLLVRYRLSGVLSYHSNSVSKLFCFLFPEHFSIEDFPAKPNGYWEDLSHAKRAIEHLLEAEGVAEKDIPSFLTKKRLAAAKLGGLLDRFHGSPIEIVQALYPGRFTVTEFQRVPNKYWYTKEHRVQAMRDYCEKQKVLREGLPLLNRAYFRKYFPRFISVADRHYDSKFYQWIIESFPEYKFSPEEFQLLAGEDGQICDSKEELVLHNFFLRSLPGAKVEREAARFFNDAVNETYIPDWIIEQNGRKYIVEYFGLYGSGLYPGYTEKTERKMVLYPSVSEYQFVAVFPEDFKGGGFGRLKMILKRAGIEIITVEDPSFF